MHEAAALDPKDRNIARDAFRAAESGDWQRAFAIIAESNDALALKTLRFLRMIEDDGSESFAEVARFMARNPDWPAQDRLQLIAESRIIDPADHALIVSFFEARPPRTERGMIRYAQALFRHGEEERATGLIRRVWREGDFSPSESKKFYARYRHLLSQEDHIVRLDTLLWDYRRRSASRMLSLVPDGERKLAQARLRLQRRQDGVDRAIRDVPGRLQNDPGLLFDRIRWRRQKRRHNDTIELLLDPPAEIVRPGMWWFEREFQVRRLLRQRKFVLAYELVSQHGQTEGADFAEAEWLAGWLALRFVSKPRRALQHFERLTAGVDRPISVARGAYWAGRAAAALGDQETAREWFQQAAALPTTFYGQEALLELASDPMPAAVVPPLDAQRLAFLSRQPVRAAQLLTDVGAVRFLTPFLLKLTEEARQPSEVRLVGELAASSGQPSLVALVGKYATWNGIVEPVTAFPIPHYRRFLKDHDGSAPRAHLLAVTRQESVFSSGVLSRAGARGLMQLMPATAALVAQQLALPYNRGLLNGAPDYNIRLGGTYLHGLLERYEEPLLAYAAYNAGPSRVESWLELHGDPRGAGRHALIDWTELIPFDETRNYVQRVSENRGVYERRLAAVDPLPVVPTPVIGPVLPPPVPAARPQLPRTVAEIVPDAGPEPAEPDPVFIEVSYDRTPVPWRKPPAGEPPPVPAFKPPR